MIYPVDRYNLNFDICAIILAAGLILYLAVSGNFRIRRIRSYFWVVLSMLLCSAGELAMDIARNDNGISFTNAQAEVATFVSHVAHNSVPFLLLAYFLSLSGLRHALSRRDLALIALPEAILVLAHVIPPIRHLIYFYYGACEYARGPLYCLYFLVVAFYVVYGVGLMVARRSSVQQSAIRYMVILCVGYLVGMAIGMVDTHIRMTNFIQVLVLASAFLLLDNEDSLRDRVTGVYNANGLSRDAYPLFNLSRQTHILSVKLQDINNYRLMVGMDATRRLLRQMGAWMQGVSSEDCRFYRVGPGEFAVLVYTADAAAARQVAERIRTRFSQGWSYSADGASLTIPAQVWLSSIPGGISSEEQVFAFSESPFDTHLPQDEVYVADEVREERRRMLVDVAIRRAIANDSFEVYYQPIYDTATGTVRSCEALVRMCDPELGPVSPEEFIKVAERSGTVSTIGSIVFDKVCAFLAKERPGRYGLDFVEVNLSPIQCMDQNLVSQLEETMGRYGVSASQITLEITESAVIHNTSRVSAIVRDLHEASFEFALDDFGTGQANYSYVREFPFSIIKIDKSFLWRSAENETDRIVLHNMLSLVGDLGLKSVVEGVETEAQRDMLLAEGVNYLQGYLYSKPVPEEQFVDYVRGFNGRPA